MINATKALTLTLVLVSAALILPTIPVAVAASEAPVKEVLSSHVGSGVNGTAPKEKICTVASGNQCQPGKPSFESGGFQLPRGITVNNASELVSPEHGDLYVADTANERVQVLTSSGQFVLMFGWDVNKTKVELSFPQAQRNVCTDASEDTCQAGTEGSATGQFAYPQGVAVDPNTGDVYVQDFFNSRIQQFTATGEFVLMFGKEVNKKGGDICTKAEEGECKAGVERAQGGTEPGAFRVAQGAGSLLAIGGPQDLLYVGEEHRVEKFEANGTPVGEIPLTQISSEPTSDVTALAVDKAGNTYLVYSVNFIGNTIREFNPSGGEIKRTELVVRNPEAIATEVQVGSIALDANGRLGVTEHERGTVESQQYSVLRGGLYETGGTSLRLITEFTNEFGATGNSDIAFNTEEELYAVGINEMVTYSPLPVAELVIEPATCEAGADNQTDATLSCVLNGKVNPWNVSETEVWFQWGKTTALGSETSKHSVEQKVPGEVIKISGKIESGLPPNETIFYQMTGYDHNLKSPESPLKSERTSFQTPSVPPRIMGEPSVSFVSSSSAVMFGEVNPENTRTEYFFEYGTCEDLDKCGSVLRTNALKSATYGKIGATLEATGLQPSTVYSYRLFAENAHKEPDVSSVGSFTTASVPAPQATTGTAAGVGATSAILSGIFDSHGQAATYAFELGIYKGSATQYGVLSSGSIGASGASVVESLGLSDLQPGTMYAYRVTLKNGSGTATGESVVFTTAGLPSVLNVPVPLVMLPVPAISFPKASVPGQTPKCKRDFKRDKHGKCVKTKRVPKKARGRAKGVRSKGK